MTYTHSDTKGMETLKLLEDVFTQRFPEWEEEAVTNLWLMDSPLYVVTLGMAYLIAVLYVGPKLMLNRKPFGLKYPMMAYNAFQVVLNSWFLISLFSEKGFLSHLVTESCSPTLPSTNKTLRWHGLFHTWIWWLIKVSDLIDTVIFVLRKKQSHVSFLHVYHHFNMAFFCWFYFRYVRGESLIFAGTINSFVHVVMYLYYFLAALGPGVRRYLWWKRYLTRLQLTQFCLIVSLHVYLLSSCSVPTVQRLFIYFAIGQTLIFTILFGNFYRKAYLKPTEESAVPSTTNNIEKKDI